MKHCLLMARAIHVADSWTKLVRFKQGLKGAVAKAGRAFNGSMLRPSEQPGVGTFKLLQVSTKTQTQRYSSRKIYVSCVVVVVVVVIVAR